MRNEHTINFYGVGMMDFVPRAHLDTCLYGYKFWDLFLEDFKPNEFVINVKSPDDFPTVNHPKKAIVNAKIEQFTGYEPSVYELQIKSYNEYSKYNQDTLSFTHDIFFC